MVDRLDVRRTDWRAVMALFVALLAVATFASLVTPALIPTLGLLVVGAGLFLPPRATVLVGVAAVLLAGILVLFGAEADYGLVRLRQRAARLGPGGAGLPRAGPPVATHRAAVAHRDRLAGQRPGRAVRPGPPRAACAWPMRASRTWCPVRAWVSLCTPCWATSEPTAHPVRGVACSMVGPQLTPA